ncbi:hypothetical protein QQG74_04440 [Micromonospora sp. FIMYZ51]|uniref:hypothetical protein n=1 Tax=Micromonospora sp. FIMYZ51 TaxID=3051832 RepID=UPI0031201520
MSKPIPQANPLDRQPDQGRDDAPLAWVGDLVHDEDADRPGIVTDILSEAIWVLRPESGSGQWICMSPERLTIVTRRAERVGKPAPLGHEADSGESMEVR